MDIGAAAPRARLPRLGGGTVELPGAAPLSLLVFWKSSCPTCRWALPYFEALHAGTAGTGFSVVGVAEDSEADAAAVAAELGLTLPVAVEPEPWATSAAYDLMTVPTLVLVDGEGRVILTSPGFAKDDVLEIARQAAALRGTAPVDPFRGEDVPAYRPG